MIPAESTASEFSGRDLFTSLRELIPGFDRSAVVCRQGGDLVELSSADVSQLLAALNGLTFFEVQKIITQAVIEDGVLGREDIVKVLEAKRQIVERSGVLEYFPHEHQMGDVAGLSELGTLVVVAAPENKLVKLVASGRQAAMDNREMPIIICV